MKSIISQVIECGFTIFFRDNFTHGNDIILIVVLGQMWQTTKWWRFDFNYPQYFLVVNPLVWEMVF